MVKNKNGADGGAWCTCLARKTQLPKSRVFNVQSEREDNPTKVVGLSSLFFRRKFLHLKIGHLGCEFVGRFSNVKSFSLSPKKNIGQIASKMLSLFLRIVECQIKNKKKDLTFDLSEFKSSNLWAHSGHPNQISKCQIYFQIVHRLPRGIW